MESQLSQVNQELALAPLDPGLLEKKTRLDHLLAEYYEDIFEAAKVKAGLKYHGQGEKPTRYFSALFKQRAEKSSITSLLSKSKDGLEIVLSTIEEISEEASSFYASLYSKKLPSSRKKSMLDYLSRNSTKTLSDSQRAECERPISIEKLGKALKELPSGKSPGIDGLPAEFLRFFWKDLKHDFYDVHSESFETGTLLETMKMSVVTLIYKKTSRQDIRNYRPISLLCTDYKIIAKVMAQRMKAVLSTLIHADQTGFLKDRYIGKNISLFLDIQEHLAKEVKPGLAFLADWEKAYDLVDRDFLKASLAQFGFGENFLRWFSILHSDTFSRITINCF